MSEDATPDGDLLSTGTEIRRQTSEFTRPSYQFKGAELLPFTYGYELLFNQVRDAEDTGLYTWLAFVFLLALRDNETPEEHRRYIVELAWNVKKFRICLMAWMDDNGPFTDADKLEAKRIYEESLKASMETAVEAVPEKGARSQKKTHRQKQPASSTS